MKKQSRVITDSLEALPTIQSQGALRQGLANAMAAVKDGSITPTDAKILAREIRKHRKKLSNTAA